MQRRSLCPALILLLAAAHPALAQPEDETIRVVPRTRQADMQTQSSYEIAGSFYGGYTRDESPRIGLGTVIDGADQRFLVESERHLDGFEFGGRLQWNIPRHVFDLHGDHGLLNGQAPQGMEAYCHPYLFLDGAVGMADGGASGREPAGNGNPAVWTYFDLDSPGGNAIANFGDTEMIGKLETEAMWYDLALGGGFQHAINDKTILSIEASLRGGNRSYDYNGRLVSIDFAGHFLTLDQDLDEHRIGLGLDARLTRLLDDHWSIYGGGGVAGYYRRASLETRQRVFAPLNGTPEDRDFTNDFDDHDSGFALGLTGEAGVQYQRGGASIRLFGRYDWISDFGEPKNPAGPAGMPTHLGTTDLGSWLAGLEVVIGY